MLFLQCGECGFRTVPGTFELGDPCPRCVHRGIAVGWDGKGPGSRIAS